MGQVGWWCKVEEQMTSLNKEGVDLVHVNAQLEMLHTR